MERFLVNVPSPWLPLGMVVFWVGIALAGFAIVRYTVDHRKLQEQHEVAGFLIAVIGVIYAVLLAFTVVAQWQSFSDAESHANAEAVAIGGLYRDAVALGPAGRRLRIVTNAYAREVAFREWPYMADHEHDYPPTDAYRNAVLRSVSELKPATPTQGDFVRQAVTDVAAVSADRRIRLRDATSTLPGALWAVLIVGGVLTIVFCYFFGLENVRAQATMLAILAALVGMSFFVILALDLPYSGGVAAKPHTLLEEIRGFCSYFGNLRGAPCP